MTIQEAWVAGMCPIVNGVTFGDGRAVLLEVSPPMNPQDSYSIRIIARTTLDAVKPNWTYFAQLHESRHPERDIVVTGGEGGLGADGFVSVTRLSDGQLIWLAFFDCSNPFENVSLVDESVCGATNLGYVWRFPLRRPEGVVVELRGSPDPE